MLEIKVVVNSEFTDHDFVYDHNQEIKELRYMSWSISQYDNINFYLVIDNVVIGALSLRVGESKDLDYGYKNWINSITIADDQQGKGYTRLLVKRFFEYCSKHNITDVLQSSYTPIGKQKAMHVFEQYAAKYPEVKFFDLKRDF